MAKFKVSQFLITLGAYRLSQDATYITLPMEREDLDASGLEDVVNQHEAGALNATAMIRGIGSDTLDETFVEAIRTGAAEVPLLVCQNLAAALAAEAWVTEAKVESWSPDRQRQQLEQQEASLWQTRVYQRGSILYNWLKDGMVDATADGPAVTRGALGDGQVLLCPLVVPDPPQATGVGTLDVVLESSALGTDWADAVTRHTFGQIDAEDLRDYELAVIDGDTDPVTDTHWRLSLTVAGAGSPEFPVLSAISIADKV